MTTIRVSGRRAGKTAAIATIQANRAASARNEAECINLTIAQGGKVHHVGSDGARISIAKAWEDAGELFAVARMPRTRAELRQRRTASGTARG